LERSLRELAIRMPMQPFRVEVVIREVVRRNRVENGLVYLQITRGVAPATICSRLPIPRRLVVTAKSMPDERRAPWQPKAWRAHPSRQPWERVDIKSSGSCRTPSPRKRRRRPARASLVRDPDGFVTEGASTTA